jgi:hypothetical protein
VNTEGETFEMAIMYTKETIYRTGNISELTFGLCYLLRKT